MKLLPFEYAVRNAGRNPARTALTTLGAAAVVFLVVLMGSFVESLKATLRATGHPANVIVLGAGSENFLEQSEIRATVATILPASVKGVRSHFGVPMASPEIVHATVVRRGGDESTATTGRGVIRGVTDAALLVHSQVNVTGGHPRGRGELMVGWLAAAKIGLGTGDLEVGRTLRFEGRDWKIAGSFAAPGTAFEAEIWAPLEDLKTILKRETITCVIARMESPAAIAQAAVFCKTRLDLELAAVPEMRYYGALADFYRPIRLLGWMMAVLVVGAGLFGGLNVMIASVAGRTRELAALETLGFSRRAIAVSLFTEFLVQVAAGSLLAVAAALVFLAGRSMRFTMGAVMLDVAPHVLMAGCAAALVLAVAGTAAGTMRLVRTPLVQLLRG